MDTIKTTAASAATAVTNIVWGTNGNSQEPQSGVQGDTSKGEPFDGGNIEETNNSTKPKQTEGGASHKEDSSVIPGDSTKAQNDVRSPSNPQTEEKNADAARNVDDSGEGPNDVKVDGPGPKPIEQVAKEHGGDAGNSSNEGLDTENSTEDKKADENKKDDQDDEDGPQKTSKGEGTGEQWVKSSGLKADGGNFDAANPGAGKEADRLLEKKGIHHEGNSVEKSPSADTGSGKAAEASPDRKEKKSFGQKIKEKLHRTSVS